MVAIHLCLKDNYVTWEKTAFTFDCLPALYFIKQKVRQKWCLKNRRVIRGDRSVLWIVRKNRSVLFHLFWDRSVFFPSFFTKKVKPWHSHTAIQRKPPRKQLQVTYKSDSRYWAGIPRIVLRILKNGLGFYWDSILPGFKKMKVFFSGIPRKQSVGFQMGKCQ